MDRPYLAALSAATDGDIVAGIVSLGDDRLLAIARQLGRHAAAAQSRRSAAARGANLSEDAFAIVDAVPEGITRAELIRRLRCSAAELDKAVGVLVYMGRITASQSDGHGRKATRYGTHRQQPTSPAVSAPAAR
jgi:hypothetical protein